MSDNHARLAHLRVHAENPIARGLSKFVQALLEDSAALRADTADQHEMAVNLVRMTQALRELSELPDDVWDKWCEASKDEFLRPIVLKFQHAMRLRRSTRGGD
jgi:hypothetical protein